jgi:hypothetical protein
LVLPDRNKLLRYYIPLLLLSGACIRHAVSVPLSDFAGYYFGSRELLLGHYANAYDMQSLNFLIAAQGYKGIFISYAPFPPFTSLVFSPFLLFPPYLSKLLFDCCSTGFFLVTLYRSCRFFSLPPLIPLLAPLIFFIPIVNNMFFGQSYLLLTCLLLEGYMAYRKQKIFLSSFFWAIAILFKLFPVLILLFLLFRKKYREAVFLCGACLLLMIPTLAINGFTAWKFYLLEIVPRVNNGELNDPFTAAFQSVFMMAKNLFVADRLVKGHPFLENRYLFILTMAIFRASVLSSSIMLTLRQKGNDLLSFSVWVTASMLLSPNGSSYSLILLIIPLMALCQRIDAQWRETIFPRPGTIQLLAAPMILLFIICNLPVQRFASLPTLLQFPRLYLILLFFILVLTQEKKRFSARLFLALSLLFILPGILRPPRSDDSSYLLKKEEHLFIYDYSVLNGKLVYYYWDDSGAREVETDFPLLSLSDKDLAIRNNQIWYQGLQLTTSPDNKRKALLTDGGAIIYLSDKDRGIGFYTLRMLRPAVRRQDAAAGSVPYR